MNFWATHAARAALDRRSVPGRGIDAGFTAALEAEAMETARQTGGDVQAALDGVHEGLEWAAAGACPGCGSRGRHGRHNASCTDPRSVAGRVYPLPEAS